MAAAPRVGWLYRVEIMMIVDVDECIAYSQAQELLLIKTQTQCRGRTISSTQLGITAYACVFFVEIEKQHKYQIGD